MSNDFARMMKWLGHEMVQGLGFNAGETFDPPREVKDRRLQPDLSLGIGNMPMDKSKFPDTETPALKDLNAAAIFPSSVQFPNLAMHLRAGLPHRSDFAIRVANMTIPKGYKISGNTTGEGQSNSFGFGVRKHVLGGNLPLLSLGANYNHVFGRFKYRTKFNVNNVQGFTADSDVSGTIQWSVNSYGVNAVVSQTFGSWTPFLGFGYNYLTGSVRARLEALSNTPLISPIVGESSEHPEQSQGRVITGMEWDRGWVNFFASGEVKAIGIGSGKAWIAQAGLMLPFHIGRSRAGVAAKKAEPRPEMRLAERDADEGDKPKPRPRPIFRPRAPEGASSAPELIFIQ